ncbi:unnamed protein product [Rhizoctonia solani]|uniref:Uncharacterized protein n=1 Tax=Rhizoctonia solani TaxID=456999 RepID=A0A8H2WEV7_9AGAM|nr:unnamed protein product [Rhizoctonia solani]
MSFLRKLLSKNKADSAASPSLNSQNRDEDRVAQPSEESAPPSYSASVAPSQPTSTQPSGPSSQGHRSPRTQYRAKDFGATSNKFGMMGLGG